MSSGFVADPDGARWTFSGALTFANAGAVHAAATSLPLPVAGDVDLREVQAADSATVAVLLALRRRANDEGRQLRFVNVPAALAALAELYGVEEILAA